MPKPKVLVLCYGNPAREDDGIGPALAERMTRLALDGVQVESNYQLMVEDSAQIAEAELVVFVDASLEGEKPFSFERAVPRDDEGYMTHSIGPEQLLGLTGRLFGKVPESYLLGVRGYSFAMFTESLTERAASNVDAAFDFLVSVVRSRSGQAPRGGNVTARDNAGVPDPSGAGAPSTGG